MTFDDMKCFSLRRRRFLEAAGKAGAGALLGSLPLLNGCKSSTGPNLPDEPELDPIPVDLAFMVYNHTQGLRGSFVKENVMSGTTLEIAVSDLIAQFGINDVDDQSIIIKKGGLGYLSYAVAKSFTGTVELTVPRENTTYYVFLLNIDGKEIYETNEASQYPRKLNWSRNIDIFRIDFDGKTGEERIWGGEFIPEIGENGIIDQYNKALNPEGIPYGYGSINRKPLPNDGSGHFGYGFGKAWGKDWASYAPGSDYPVFWIGINPTIANTVQWQVSAGLEALVGMLMIGTLDFIGLNMGMIHDGPILNQKGKDFIAYLYVKL